ncbi:beta-N-acetylhexosaminidase [Bacillus horti]|uniref:Beta-N-acetylhexosaminidase n=1 Tax=Caldalkalibacillus horti TaxID=77523 RepID=A0ABT9VZ85_9BACI|nr:beta-N-acetylhexosaminidase [Bacillus horti]MDQ0166293.1 beta-N-acetylhexosaminidase [Bacillus horti]
MSANVTLRQKIGQLMVFGFAGTAPSKEILSLIREQHVGGIILFGRNVGTPEEVLSLTTALQKEAKESNHKLPLLICTDQENGVVRRMGEGTTVFPGAMLLGATQKTENAFAVGQATGKELKAVGINWNLAPTVDVNNNAENPVIGVRSFGEDAQQVAEFSQAWLQGLQQAGVMSTLKHFPGHGDTSVDSHLDLPVIEHDMTRLRQIELLPFQKGIEAGADVVMSSHIYFPALEKRKGVPATLSRSVMTGLLREELQFNGVVTTDCLEMNAIAHTIGTAQGAVEALKAGVDLIMISHTHSLQQDALQAILAAVEQGELEEARIHEAYDRVQRLKGKYLSWTELDVGNVTQHVPAVVGCEEHLQLAKDIYRQGITIIDTKSNREIGSLDNNQPILPLSMDKEHRVLVLYPQNSYLMQVEDKRYSSYALGQVVQEILPSAMVNEFINPPDQGEISRVLEMVQQLHKNKELDTIIIGSLSAAQSKEQQELINKLAETELPVVVIAMRSPYDLAYLSSISTYVATYEFSTPALQMAVRALFGLEQVSGILPVTLPQA